MEKGQIVDINEVKIQKFINEIRPPVEIRNELDIGYTFENNSLEIFEIRPRFNNPEEKIQSPVAKAKYVKTQRVWVIYWMRASGKWERYEPSSEVNELSSFFEMLMDDKHGCFWG